MLLDPYIQKLCDKAKVKHPDLTVTARIERLSFEDSELVYHVKLGNSVNREFSEEGVNAFLFGLTL